MPKHTFDLCEDAVKDFAERIRIQNPGPGDQDALIMDQETIAPGTRLIIELPVEEGHTVHVTKIRVDFQPLTNYKFILGGVVYEGDNEAPFQVPQQERKLVTIIIENLSAFTEVWAWRVEGWTSVR